MWTIAIVVTSVGLRGGVNNSLHNESRRIY